MRKLSVFLTLLAAVALGGCDQMLARSFGGEITTKALPTEAELLTLTWKGDSLWVLYYLPSTKQCVFREDSSIGALEGKVLIENCKPAAYRGKPSAK